MLIDYVLCMLLVAIPVGFCGEHPDGASKVSREQDVLGNYKFDYTVSNADGGQFRREGTDELGRVIGSYGLSLGDGRERVVDYIADKHGFRAHVRSNEPGVASSESDAVTVVKTDHAHDFQLDAAASSHGDDGRVAYGKRLKTLSSRVTYAEPNSEDTSNTAAQPNSDTAARESRQRHIEDFIPRPLTPSEQNVPYPNGPFRQPNFDVPPKRRLRPDTYLPPIDPHTAIRRPEYYLPRDRSTDRNYYTSTTSRRPFVPPYGGFDDEPLLTDRRPVAMTTVHGGLNRNPYRPAPTPSTVYGAGRYPSDVPPIRDHGIVRYPHRAIPDDGYGVPHQPGGILPPQPHRPPGNVFIQSPLIPPFNGNSPNSVIRAVPIPNGIQAVRVDPSSGRILERLVYPLYLRYQGNPNYDRNILLHNDEVSDDIDGDRDILRNYDIPLRRRLALRGPREQPTDDDYTENKQYNKTYIIDEKSLSKPTARDLALVHRQLQFIDGFRNYPNRAYSSARGNAPDPEELEYDDFDDSQVDYRRVRNDAREFIPYEDDPRSDYPHDEEFVRYLRESDSRPLTPADSKEIALASLKEGHSETEGSNTEIDKSGIEKE